MSMHYTEHPEPFRLTPSEDPPPKRKNKPSERYPKGSPGIGRGRRYRSGSNQETQIPTKKTPKDQKDDGRIVIHIPIYDDGLDDKPEPSEGQWYK